MKIDGPFQALTQTATGTEEASVAGKSRWSWAFVIAGISTNVTLRVEGSMDGTNWFALSADTVYTSNGTYILSVTGHVSPLTRLYFVAKTGGSPTITPYLSSLSI